MIAFSLLVELYPRQEAAAGKPLSAAVSIRHIVPLMTVILPKLRLTDDVDAASFVLALVDILDRQAASIESPIEGEADVAPAISSLADGCRLVEAAISSDAVFLQQHRPRVHSGLLDILRRWNSASLSVSAEQLLSCSMPKSINSLDSCASQSRLGSQVGPNCSDLDLAAIHTAGVLAQGICFTSDFKLGGSRSTLVSGW